MAAPRPQPSGSFGGGCWLRRSAKKPFGRAVVERSGRLTPSCPQHQADAGGRHPVPARRVPHGDPADAGVGAGGESGELQPVNVGLALPHGSAPRPCPAPLQPLSSVLQSRGALWALSLGQNMWELGAPSRTHCAPPAPQQASHHHHPAPHPPSAPQEASHHHLMRRRALWDSQTPPNLKHRRSLVAAGQLSLEEKKRRIVRNLRRLEGLGLVAAAQHYQGLVNELAKAKRGRWAAFWEGGGAFIYAALLHVESC